MDKEEINQYLIKLLEAEQKDIGKEIERLRTEPARKSIQCWMCGQELPIPYSSIRCWECLKLITKKIG